MERRYKLMSALGVRNLAGYNEKIAEADRMMRPIPDPYWKPGDSMDAQHPVLKKEPYIVVLWGVEGLIDSGKLRQNKMQHCH
ncbi:FtsK/SpoIIIE domain-containing protein, partial [Klebsiella pneumoniae]|uniref:FtsK/SpoIIIE domain-containing protein n=1 Tax=Klebsiella pneumoniae TaxID=573 RepID=UPI00226DB776